MLRGLSIIKNDDLILIKVEMPINHALPSQHEKEAKVRKSSITAHLNSNRSSSAANVNTFEIFSRLLF